MTDPIGQGTYNGLCAPLHGEFVLRQENSSNAILSLMHSTANTGRLLMGIDYKPIEGEGYSSLLTDLAVFDIDADGGFRAVSGTTVVMELNSSGLLAGTGAIQVVDASGGSAKRPHTNVIEISSDGTTAVVLLSTNACKLHLVAETSAAGFSSVVVSLPSSDATGIAPGMWWDVFCPNTSAAGVIDLALIGTDHSIICHMTTNTINTSKAITHETSGPIYWRVMCVTTGSTMTYVVSNFLGTAGGSSFPAYDGIVEGSSALT